ncbi:GatB/YqeY domain-containing protein [Candidatus Saccharibacteria bacterium]|nr:GatB/YqeY domain-containing protein [Candidatus Saccharibacteria bacterium]
MLKQRINDDLKAAMLSGDSARVDTLKMIKTALQYKEVELGIRDTGIDDDEATKVLAKEAKKRQEAAEMYGKAGREEQAASEKAEFDIISDYLPEQMGDDELKELVRTAIAKTGASGMQDMGKVIGAVKAEAGSSVDGGRVAALVKQELSS